MGDTRNALLTAAEHLVRTRGYSGFSYADLAEQVGIRKASIHHHFPAKADLCLALVEDYAARVGEALAAIEARHDGAMARLKAYGAVYVEGARKQQLCRGGMMASDASSLPPQVRDATQRFIEAQLTWLSRVIRAGQRAGELREGVSAPAAAAHFLGLMQGVTLVAWAVRDPSIIQRALSDGLAGLMR